MKQKIEEILIEIRTGAEYLENAATAGGELQNAFDLTHDPKELEQASRILAEHVSRIETELETGE